MRVAFFLLLLAASSFPANLTVTRFMNVTTSTACPGDWLFMNATASDGTPAPGVELRLVLYEPYQGLRALEHSDENGLASVQLTKAGHYRLYMYTSDYNHDQYVEFDYPSLCPPPPPKAMDVSVDANCTEMLLHISVTAGGLPLPGVFVTTQNWSSMTSESGSASFPFKEGYLFINATKPGYSNPAFYYLASCAPPPECTDDSACGDAQECTGQRCVNITGECGHPSNHSWVPYACCADSDCGNSSICSGNTCLPMPKPAGPGNETVMNETGRPENGTPGNETGGNTTANATGPSAESGASAPPVCPLGLALLAMIPLLWRR